MHFYLLDGVLPLYQLLYGLRSENYQESIQDIPVFPIRSLSVHFYLALDSSEV